MFRVWYSTGSLADWVIQNTSLRSEQVEKKKISESDANNPGTFHRMPTHLKGILYLDAPDLIVEYDSEPVFSLEVTTEAGTGHNAFQRFARIAASVENGVPAFYVYPEAGYVHRQGVGYRWDKLNPLIFEAMEKAMRVYGIPALLYYFPSHFRTQDSDFNPITKGLKYDDAQMHCPDSSDGEMRKLFEAVETVIRNFKRHPDRSGLMNELTIQERRDYMENEKHAKQVAGQNSSPITATQIIPTSVLLKHLSQYGGAGHDFGDLLTKREQTLVYKVNAKFRGDPYPGALAALDYIKCRKGKTFEERNFNLVMTWGNFSLNGDTIVLTGDQQRSIEMFMEKVRETYSAPGKIILNKTFGQLSGEDIPRYFMQVRFGSTFTKVKHLRVYSYFCDAILFPDGALWREG